MTEAEVDQSAQIVWDYMQLHEKPRKSDVIFTLCSVDTRVAERAAQLFLDGYGGLLVFSGGNGRGTTAFTRPEAEIFASVARTMGAPDDKIVVEDASTNTGENIRFTYALLQAKKLQPKSLLLVQKPYMERRTYATFKKQWPDADVTITVTSPEIPYQQYCNEANPKDLVINFMVGDLERIREYPKLGFQIEQEIPTNVWSAYERLVGAGFDKQLITGKL